MNRTEAKAYALNELGLDRDTVRQFGNLSRTQTWLDAIAAQNALAPREAMIVEVTLAQDVTDVEVTPALAAQEEALIPRETMIVETKPEIAIPDPASLDNSFEAFWDSAPAVLQPQPLLNVSGLDGDWDEPQPSTSPASEVIVYPIVIGLLMLWAMVQLLLLAGRGIAICLTALANILDAAASRRLNRDCLPYPSILTSIQRTGLQPKGAT